MYSQSTLFGENLALIQFGVRHEKDWNLAWIWFGKNQHFRLIAPKIFFVPKIYPSKVGVIGVLIAKGVKRHQKHNICTCSISPSIASKRNLKLIFAFCSTLKFNSMTSSLPLRTLILYFVWFVLCSTFCSNARHNCEVSKRR